MPYELEGLSGSLVCRPLERVWLGVVLSLGGTSSWATPNSLVSSLEVSSPQLLGEGTGLLAGFRAILLPIDLGPYCQLSPSLWNPLGWKLPGNC